MADDLKDVQTTLNPLEQLVREQKAMADDLKDVLSTLIQQEQDKPASSKLLYGGPYYKVEHPPKIKTEGEKWSPELI